MLQRRRWRLLSFCLGLVLLTGCNGASVSRDDPSSTTYQPTTPRPREVGAQLVGPIVYTVDARSHDVQMYFDFARGSIVPVQNPRTDSWDLIFQRYTIKTNGGDTNPAGQGAVASLQGHDLTAVIRVPEKAEFVSDIHPKNRPSSYNPVLAKWFNYSYLANVLAPRSRVYIVRTHDGKYAKMRLLSYYCTGQSPGCVTFEYVYQGDGSTNLAEPSAWYCVPPWPRQFGAGACADGAPAVAACGGARSGRCAVRARLC